MSMNAIAQSNADLAGDKDWWRGSVIYQIYPRSFQDSSGDGVGDLKGITQRLSYIASLGVDAIWISPFFKSPMKDFGYDVSDYYAIDPMFGTIDDFDRLIDKAHGLGIRVIIDQVLSHTSDQHPWFVESKASQTNPKSDWFVWADAKPDGTAPNNWLSIFGGSAWQWDAGREQYYLHNFLTCQPDLNLHNTDVQDALLDSVRFWLDRGVDGFRLDTVNFYFADQQLRDNPALPKEQRNSTLAPSVNPYNHQKHIYSKNRPENLGFLQRFRALLDEYPAATSVGEIGDAQYGMELMGEYTKGSDRVHMCYTFEFLSTESLNAERIKSVLEKLTVVAPDGWACWALTNHDIKRHTTRWNLDEQGRRLYTLLMMCLRGSVCLYQGEELGLPEADIAFEDIQDPYGIEFWPEYKGRDGCRTPMVWNTSQNHGGFSVSKPWLPIPDEHLPLSVSEQELNSDSLLNFYRAAMAFRKKYPALIVGEQSQIAVTENILAFERTSDNSTLYCAFNISSEESVLGLPDGDWELLGGQLGACTELKGNKVVLAPNQVLLAEKR